MDGKALAAFVIGMKPKSKRAESEDPEKEGGSEEHEKAVLDIWDALKSDDREAFVDAVMSYVAMCGKE